MIKQKLQEKGNEFESQKNLVANEEEECLKEKETHNKKLQNSKQVLTA